MPRHAEISPNTPDVAPDYVDTAGGSPVATLPPPPAGNAEPDESPRRPSLEPALVLNAEFVAPAAESPSPHREGECVPNIPDVPPELVSEDKVVKPARPAGPATGLPAPGEKTRRSWLRWDVALLVLVLSLFGCMVVSQAISALAMTATLPVWMQYALLVPLGLFFLGILYFCGTVVAAWLRLRTVRQVDLAALEELRRRSQTRKDGVEHFQAARLELENYLAAYPANAEGAQRLKTAGISSEAFEALDRERNFLLDRPTDSHSWLGEFQERFQSRLDKTAKGRIRQWAVVAAGCAMASPVPLLDAALILGVAMKMIKDLCLLYNVRSGRASSLVLLSRAVTTAFIAGIAEDAVSTAADAAGDELTGIFGESALGGFGAGIAKTLAPKLGEGAVNAFFINRLGKATMRLLQPLKPAK